MLSVVAALSSASSPLLAYPLRFGSGLLSVQRSAWLPNQRTEQGASPEVPSRKKYNGPIVERDAEPKTGRVAPKKKLRAPSAASHQLGQAEIVVTWKAPIQVQEASHYEDNPEIIFLIILDLIIPVGDSPIHSSSPLGSL
jgi:hypothetical protein